MDPTVSPEAALGGVTGMWLLREAVAFFRGEWSSAKRAAEAKAAAESVKKEHDDHVKNCGERYEQQARRHGEVATQIGGLQREVGEVKGQVTGVDTKVSGISRTLAKIEGYLERNGS